MTDTKDPTAPTTRRKKSAVTELLAKIPVITLNQADFTTESAIELYEADEHAWIGQQITALRHGDLDHLDRENLIEFLTDVAKRDLRELESRLEVLCAHVLKCLWQPERDSASWHITIAEQQRQIKRLRKSLPSLSARIDSIFGDVLPNAVSAALRETGLKRRAVRIPKVTLSARLLP